MHDFPCQGAKHRVLFLCKQRTTHYGTMTSSGLLNSARMVAADLAEHGIAETKLVDVVDGNCIDREVHQYKPTHVVLEAYWVTPEKLAELVRLHPKMLWTVRNHSKLPFLAGEGMPIDWSYRYVELTRGKAFVLSSNSPEAVEDFRAMGLPTGYTPNIYHGQIRQRDPHQGEGFLDVGCFGAIRPLKNHLMQAVAALGAAEKLGKHLRFWINVGRQEMRGEPVLRSLQGLFSHHPTAKLEVLDWLDHSAFLDVVQRMDLVAQVSLTETFNIVAADAVYCDVPVVGSQEIPWLPPQYVADPHSVESIRNVMVSAYGQRGAARRCQHAIVESNREAREAWVRFLG